MSLPSIPYTYKTTVLTIALSVVSCFGFTSVASAQKATGTAGNQQELTSIQSSGDKLIASRLDALQKLSDKINSMQKLKADSKASLLAGVANSKAGLTALQTKLDSDTTVADAKADRATIMSNYRVFALVIPQVHLVKVADDQLNTEQKLSTFAGLLQSHLPAQNADALKTKLADMNAKIAAAQKQTQAAETALLGFKPADYNSNHQLLASQLANLKQASTLNKAAWLEGKEILKAK